MDEQRWRTRLTKTRRWVVKIGSALLTNAGEGIDRKAIADWVEQIVALRQSGLEVVLVSSGSVAEGMARLKLSRRPRRLHEIQAAAAVGQMGLIETYESSFQLHGLHTAQVLLTHEDLVNRQRYLNARSTLLTLLRFGAIPIINENDTVATEEIRFGDNDTLAALVANLVGADALVILTDRDGLYDADPGTSPAATLIHQARANDSALDRVAGVSASGLGRGGMVTKLSAARVAARSGAPTIIAGGRQPGVLTRLRSGLALGTLLTPDAGLLVARKQWLAGHLQGKGRLVLDDGAVKVLRESGSSLLPVGVQQVFGQFTRGDMVVCEDASGQVVARGLVNYGDAEARGIAGHPSSRIESILGYLNEPELIHRDNLVVV